MYPSKFLGRNNSSNDDLHNLRETLFIYFFVQNPPSEATVKLQTGNTKNGVLDGTNTTNRPPFFSSTLFPPLLTLLLLLPPSSSIPPHTTDFIKKKIMQGIKRKHPTCARCKQHYEAEAASPQVPVLLPCGHAMCKQCVDELRDDSCETNIGNMLVKAIPCVHNCPLVPIEDTANPLTLHTELMHELQNTTYSTTLPLCEECEEAPCVSWCGICTTSLCGECFATIHAPKVMRKHAPIPLAERPYPVESCLMHHMPLLSFCNSCTLKVCEGCIEAEHNGDAHIVVPLDSAAKSAVERTSHQLHKVDVKRDKLRHITFEVQSVIAALQPAHDASLHIIDQEFDSLKTHLLEAINEQKEKLLSECRNMKESKLALLKGQREGVAKSLSTVMSVRGLYREVLREHPIAVLGVQRELASRMGELNAACSAIDSEVIVEAGVPVSFQSGVEEVVLGIARFGEVGLGSCPRITASRITSTGEERVPVILPNSRRPSRQSSLPTGSLPGSLPISRASTANDLNTSGNKLRRLRSLAGSRNLMKGGKTAGPSGGGAVVQPAAP